MAMKYNNYLISLSNIDNPKSEVWDGDLFLPPCGCASPLTMSTALPMYCTEVNSTKQFDYSSTKEIKNLSLINLRDYTIPGSKSRTRYGYWLCNKYSLSKVSTERKNELLHLASTNQQEFTQSKEFSKCLELLRGDLNVLTPLNRCKVTMQKHKRINHQLKYIVSCAQSHKFQPWNNRKHKAPAFKSRKSQTTKPTTTSEKCTFNVSLFFDLKCFRWFMKVSNNMTHTNHHPTDDSNFKFQQKHLTKTMNNELQKLNNGNTSTTTQANILMANNDTILNRHTIYNKKIAERNNDLNGMTDCEQLLNALQNENNVTYFALFGESICSNLLTIPIVKQAKHVLKNQKHAEALSLLPVSPKPSEESLMDRIYTERAEKLAKAPRSDLIGIQSRTLYPPTSVNVF